jgi:hypothetical protein
METAVLGKSFVASIIYGPVESQAFSNTGETYARAGL